MTQYPHLYQAGQVDGGALLDVSLLGPEHDGLGLDDPQEHPVLHVRRGAHLGIKSLRGSLNLVV